MNAVIFDMNGVIIDDERFHQESWKQFCAHHGFVLSEDEFTKHVFGRTEQDTFSYLYKRPISEVELERYSNERVDIAIHIVTPHLAIAPGLRELLHELHSRAIPLAVATSSRKRYVTFVMDTLKLWDYFPVIVTAQDIVHGKPDPEIYIKAASLIQRDPSSCVVFEDSLSGIQAAKSAGMRVIAITTTHRRERLTIADSIIDSFQDISVDSILL